MFGQFRLMVYGFRKEMVAFWIILPVFLTADLMYHTSSSLWGFSIAMAVKTRPCENSGNFSATGNAKLLGGLLSPEIKEESCYSRYQTFLYRKPSPYKPSSYLISRLRNYERLHKRCGPHTESYNKSFQLIKTGKHGDISGCNYVVWVALNGLGNRMLSLAATFLYALLTDRVLLVDQRTDIANLFCEPFPYSSWLLPKDFPIKRYLKQNSPYCYGCLLKKKMVKSSLHLSWHPALYLHLAHDYNEYDKLFFCDLDQDFLQKVPWLIIRSNNYFAPALFLVPSFEQELNKLFPNKETVFHHLSRFLFLPSNQVWGLITRYYRAYLARADERIGIQIRIFHGGSNGTLQHVLDRIVACTINQMLLPEVNGTEPKFFPTQKLKAVLVTSLVPDYSEKLRNMYWLQQTVNGDMIAVHQPSHEEHQHKGDNWYDMKAWAEIYLLSLSDSLVTSTRSTFGYVAHGLGGLKPWILYEAVNKIVSKPPCSPAMSMEPCFMYPPNYDCKAKKKRDSGKTVRFLRHCKDVRGGVKLVNINSSF